VTQLDQFITSTPKESLATTSPDTANVVRLMTIHKSKGTEYPLVVVAGLADRGFVADTGPITLHHGLAGTELALRVPVMRDDADRASDRLAPSMSWKLLRDHLEERSDAEAKRVLYVALTRARDRLVLSGQVGPRPPVRRTAFSWLTADPAMAAALGAPEDGTFELGGVPVTVLAPREVGRPDAERADALLGVIDALPVPDGSPGPSPEPAVAGPRSVAVTRLARVAATPREAFARDVLGVDDALPSPGTDGDEDPRETAARLGRAVHGALAGVTVPGPVDADVEAHVAAFGRAPHGAAALTAPSSRAEVTFLLPLHRSGRPRLEGTLDRLYRDPDGTWTIVDAKTSRPRPGETLDAHARRHGHDVQLLLYAIAVRSLLDLPDDARIRAVLVFTHPSLPDPGREWIRTWTARELPDPGALAVMAHDLARAGLAPDEDAFAETVSSLAELARP